MGWIKELLDRISHKPQTEETKQKEESERITAAADQTRMDRAQISGLYIGIDMASGTDKTIYTPIPAAIPTFSTLEAEEREVIESKVQNILSGGEGTFTLPKISKEARMIVFGERMTNNWLKMHRYPKRRRIKKRFQQPAVKVFTIGGERIEDRSFTGDIGNHVVTMKFKEDGYDREIQVLH